MCPHYANELDKQGSFKVVDSRVVSGMFGDFYGREFS